MRTYLFALRVGDLDRSLAFYREVGYVELSTVPFDDGSSLVWLRLPGEPSVSLELVPQLLHPDHQAALGV